MIEPCDFRLKRIALNHGGGSMPAIGFGTLIADAAITISATKDALEAGYRHFDCAERYRNEREVGDALQVGLAAGGIAREDIFVTTKLWNSNHRPERVNRLSTQALKGFDSTIWIFISFIRRSHSRREMSRIPATQMETSSMTKE